MLHVLKVASKALLVIVLAGAALPAGAVERKVASLTPPVRSPFMRVHRPSLPPYGYVRFCREFPAECRVGRMEEARIEGTADRMAELDLINRHINRIIEPATDQEIYGEVERWALPATRGDCEDYALLKRHKLMKRGWPASALLMTVVRDEKGEGHAVLTARTSKGDYVLDNKTDEMRLWSDTPYTFVMRQSYIDPNVWLSLEAGEPSVSPALAGNRGGGQ